MRLSRHLTLSGKRQSAAEGACRGMAQWLTAQALEVGSLSISAAASAFPGFSKLAVFDARFYIRVRRMDEPVERCGVRGGFRPQLYMAHELAGALQQTRRIRQRYAVKEPHVYVRGKYIDVAEGRIAQTCHGTAIVQKLPDLVPAFSHHLKPLMRDGPQCVCTFFHPRIDGGIAFDSAVESQQVRSHRRLTSFPAESDGPCYPYDVAIRVRDHEVAVAPRLVSGPLQDPGSL